MKLSIMLHVNLGINFHSINETIILVYKKQRMDLPLMHVVNRLLIFGKR